MFHFLTQKIYSINYVSYVVFRIESDSDHSKYSLCILNEIIRIKRLISTLFYTNISLISVTSMEQCISK